MSLPPFLFSALRPAWVIVLGWMIAGIASGLNAQSYDNYQQYAQAASGAGAQAQGGQPLKVSAKYRLQPTDLLKFVVYQEPELEREVRVEGDGTVVLPLIGKVRIGGMPLNEAQEHIQYLYNKDYLVNPQVNLLILEYSPRRVQVLGQVNRPGFVIIPPEEQLTLTQAISGANGFHLRANDKSVQIRRQNADGRTEVIEINVKEILRNPKATDPIVRDGDTIFVPESTF